MAEQPRTRADAQQRVDEIRTFQAELVRLEADGVVALSNEHRAAVADHHEKLLRSLSETFDIDRDSRAKQLSLGMRIASFLGALALAASVFFLFYQFWGLLPTAAQVGILVTASLATLAGTLWLGIKDSSGYFVKLAAMVAFACFVLNITMLGQIYNITPSDKALLPWGALALLLAYVCDLRLLLAAGIACIVAFIAARTGTWGGVYWLGFGERPENFFPAAVALFFIPSVIRHQHFAGFPALYRILALLTLFIPMLVLGNWGEGSYLDIDDDLIEGSYQLLGFVGTAVAIWFGAKRGWNEVVNTSLVLFVIFLYTKFYDWWWEIMPKYLFFLVLGLTAVLFLFVLGRLRGVTQRAGAQA